MYNILYLDDYNNKHFITTAIEELFNYININFSILEWSFDKKEETLC